MLPQGAGGAKACVRGGAGRRYGLLRVRLEGSSRGRPGTPPCQGA